MGSKDNFFGKISKHTVFSKEVPTNFKKIVYRLRGRDDVSKEIINGNINYTKYYAIYYIPEKWAMFHFLAGYFEESIIDKSLIKTIEQKLQDIHQGNITDDLKQRIQQKGFVDYLLEGSKKTTIFREVLWFGYLRGADWGLMELAYKEPVEGKTLEELKKELEAPDKKRIIEVTEEEIKEIKHIAKKKGLLKYL